MTPKRYPMIERMLRGPFDDLDTPRGALDPLLPYLPPGIIWECAPGRGVLVGHLREVGASVVSADMDFFSWEPDAWDFIVTNPPFSQKAKFLARARALHKPFAMLLPVTVLGVRSCQRSLDECEVIFLPRRIDFSGKRKPWFAVAWFTVGLGIGRQIIFGENGT